ncbi:hypothetical protein [Pontibacter oryzae]|uniref:Uncharacterized protein n=1 Tax=Pontibacter oryzae TaxID=2304593 RepID=A0A399RTW1_9BACT|nr:hypothetical protein [Pontibacter oryzae]RIJ34291.1 hypothetical protein D1627_15315 [Pontibacter oryzae]
MIKWKILLGLLLCSCATQRQAEKHFDQHTDQLAKYVDQNEAYTQQFGASYAARHFAPAYYPPAICVPQQLKPGRVPTATVLPVAPIQPYAAPPACPECPSMVSVKNVYLTDSAQLNSLQAKLLAKQEIESALSKQLRRTQAQRDYWHEMNRKKFWALLAMVGFAMLYILFRVLAARVKQE